MKWMNKIIVMLSMLMIMALSVAGIPTTGFFLAANITFDDINISDFVVTNSAQWVINNVGCRKPGFCLDYQETTGSRARAYIFNNTFLFNTTNNTVMIKGWELGVSGSGTQTGGYIFLNTTNGFWDSMNARIISGDTDRQFHQSDYGSIASEEFSDVNFAEPNVWYWVNINITDLDATVFWYTNSSETTLLHTASISVPFMTEVYQWGFQSTRVWMWDDTEFWVRGTAPPPPVSMTLNWDLPTSTTSEVLNINFNATLVSVASDIFNCSLFQDQSLTNTSLDINLSMNNFFGRNLGMIEQDVFFNLTCSNAEISDDIVGTVSVDSFNPRIETNFVNNSVFTVQLDDTFTARVNFTNDNLQNYTVIFSDGVTNFVDLFANLAGLNITFIENITFVNVSSTLGGAGNYTYNLTATDQLFSSNEVYNFEVVACPNVWVQSLGACINDLQLITYADSNACITMNNPTVPANNGTFQACTSTVAIGAGAFSLLSLFTLILVAVGIIVSLVLLAKGIVSIETAVIISVIALIGAVIVQAVAVLMSA